MVPEKIKGLWLIYESFVERLKKIIWLLIRLTSGLANEYKIYFPDYEEDSHYNEVIEIIRSYRNVELRERLEIRRLELSDSIRKFSFITEKSSTIINENAGEATASSLKIQSYLTEYLPYGDSIKPFLNSEAIKSEDLKTFLNPCGRVDRLQGLNNGMDFDAENDEGFSLWSRPFLHTSPYCRKFAQLQEFLQIRLKTYQKCRLLQCGYAKKQS